MTADQGATDQAFALVQAIASTVQQGPVLLVADNATIARSAPAWARAFAERGWLYRVRLSAENAADVAERTAAARSLVREAHSLGATVIVGVGGAATRAAARSAAAEAGLPVLDRGPWPAD